MIEEQNPFQAAEQYLKKELLDDNPKTIKWFFNDQTVDNILLTNMYHTQGVEHAKEIFELVKIVVDHGDTLQSVPELTPTSDWKTIIYNYYDIEEPQPTQDTILTTEKVEDTKYLKDWMIREAINNKDIIGLVLSSTRFRPIYHLPQQYLKQYGRQFLNRISDSWYLIEFIHSTLVTACSPNDFKQTPITECINLLTYYLDLNPQEQEYKLLIDLATEIYNYFNENDTINLVSLKQQFLSAKDLENTLDVLQYEYHNDKYKYQLISLVRIITNKEQTLKDLPELTDTSDWKTQILNHYNLLNVVYPDIKELFPDKPFIFDNVPDYEFYDIEESELPKMMIDLFDVEKNSQEWKEQAILREKSKGGAKGGKASKVNHKKSITIINKETNEKYHFDKLGDCMKFLNVIPMTFNRFLKGTTKLNKKWQVIDISTSYIE